MNESFFSAPQLKRDPLGEHPLSGADQVTLKPFALFATAWALAGLGAVVGSILGNAAGKAGLFGGAVIGGVIGVGAAVGIVIKLRWLSIEDRAGALLGGVSGFAVAAPIASPTFTLPSHPCSSVGLRASVCS